MQSACAVLYYRLWPLWLNQIFPHYLTDGTIFRGGGGITERKICALIFCTVFIWNISYSRRNSTRYFHKCGNVFLSISVILVRVSLNLDFLDKFLKKKNQISNVNKIRPVGAEFFHMDMTKLIVAFRNLANVRRKRKNQDTSQRFVGAGGGSRICNL
jgi:D-alanyl-lipoteichoic acid acyltransferase DltB (MBOAT superfamily)